MTSIYRLRFLKRYKASFREEEFQPGELAIVPEAHVKELVQNGIAVVASTKTVRAGTEQAVVKPFETRGKG